MVETTSPICNRSGKQKKYQILFKRSDAWPITGIPTEDRGFAGIIEAKDEDPSLSVPEDGAEDFSKDDAHYSITRSENPEEQICEEEPTKGNLQGGEINYLELRVSPCREVFTARGERKGGEREIP